MSHDCPATGCTAAISPSMLFCWPHWFMVPKPLRYAVSVTWADGAGEGTLAHCQAIRTAVAAVNRRLAEAGR